MVAKKERHKWSKTLYPVRPFGGREEQGQDCERCGMSRCKDPGTSSLYLYRAPKAERWQGYVSGFTPKCEPKQVTP